MTEAPHDAPTELELARKVLRIEAGAILDLVDRVDAASPPPWTCCSGAAAACC
jgi:hypothetical protein